MNYYKITPKDLLSVATKAEVSRLKMILDIGLEKTLARRWCDKNNYKLGGYLGRDSWDASKPEPMKEVAEKITASRK